MNKLLVDHAGAHYPPQRKAIKAYLSSFHSEKLHTHSASFISNLTNDTTSKTTTTMAVAASYTPPPSLGLRQRHPLATGAGMVVNENSNPNGGGGILLSRDDTNNDSMMKIGGGNGATTRRPPPPRASLTTSRPKFNRTSPSPSRSKTAAAETQLANDAAVGNRSALALVPTDNSAAGEDEENLSLWVVGYGKTKCPSAPHIRCFFFRRSFTSSCVLLRNM